MVKTDIILSNRVGGCLICLILIDPEYKSLSVDHPHIFEENFNIGSFKAQSDYISIVKFDDEHKVGLTTNSASK